MCKNMQTKIQWTNLKKNGIPYPSYVIYNLELGTIADLYCFTTQNGHCLRVGTVLLLQNEGNIFVISLLRSLNGEQINRQSA